MTKTFTYQHKLEGEGAGSMYQRELLTLIASLVTKNKYYRTQNKLAGDHYNSGEYNKYQKGWAEVTNFLTQWSTSDIEPNSVTSMTFSKILNIIDSASDELFNDCVCQIRENYAYDDSFPESYKITIHLRATSKGDSVTGLPSLPYQYFDYDYKLPFENHEYYSALYANLVNSIARSQNQPVILVICTTASEKHVRTFLEKIDVSINVSYERRTDYEDFMHMVNCDALIAAQSSLSYLATFLNRNKKYIRNGYRHRLPADVICFHDDKYIKSTRILKLKHVLILYILKLKEYFLLKTNVSK